MKSNVLPIILIIAAVGLFFSYTNPNYSRVSNSTVFADKGIKELREEEVKYDDALNKTLEMGRDRQKLFDIFNAIPENLRDNLKKLLPDNVDSVRLVIDISDLAVKNNVKMEDVDISVDKVGTQPVISAETQDPNRAAVSFSTESTNNRPVSSGRKVKKESVDLGFVVSGEYADFKNFVTSLERSLRVLDINSITFKSEEEGIYTYDVKIKTYLLK